MTITINNGLTARTERRLDDAYDRDNMTTLLSGECFVSNVPDHVIVTILGSCVSACMYDPVAQIGGMNHFLLPEGPTSSAADDNDAARYGCYAMEELINAILKRGGMKKRLEVKIFGGANVIESSTQIGSRNVAFVRDFLRNERLPIVSEDLGGDYPRRVRFYPTTGKAMMLRLRRKDDFAVVKDEKAHLKTIQRKPVEGSIELF